MGRVGGRWGAGSRGARVCEERGRQAGARGLAWRVGAAGARGAHDRQTGAHKALDRGALGTRAGCRRAACLYLGVMAGLWAVHSVHSAYFDTVSTQYCS